MDDYYVSKQARDNGDHEVHKSGCRYIPLERYVLALGQFVHSADAVNEAKGIFPQANGCIYCCFTCYTNRPSDG